MAQKRRQNKSFNSSTKAVKSQPAGGHSTILPLVEILVLSDIHCYYHSKDAPITSRMLSNTPLVPPSGHPFEALKLRLKETAIPFDCVLCPGDVTENGDMQGLLTGWHHIQDVSSLSKDRLALATLGNHDVDSYGVHNLSDPFHLPKTFSPNFPVSEKGHWQQYYSDHFYIQDNARYEVLSINSCYSHISKANSKKCVLPPILDSLKQRFESKPRNKPRIALVHHHPIKHSNVDTAYSDEDVMENGDELIAFLREHSFDLLIHGHKHDPRVTVYDGLPILACGSFSSRRNVDDLQAQNVFPSCYN